MSSHTWTHGAYIRAHREALGLSQAALARAARVTTAMINRLESGRRPGRRHCPGRQSRPQMRQVRVAILRRSGPRATLLPTPAPL
jgi:predicted transcriptional regulator